MTPRHVDIGNITLGNDLPLVFIVGPNTLESRAHALSRKYGAARIAHELRAKGLDKGLAEQTAKAARATEVERAREIWRRKFRVAPRTREERARQMRFLQSRGFSFDAIRAVVGGPGED